MARANVGLREGRWFWELRVISGIRDPTNPTAKPDQPDFGGHFRAGISRREASLEHPCGFDAYSYSIRDAHGQILHMSMPEKFFPPEESLCQGDVVGFELQLPSLALHRKVVEGTFNKAVDLTDESDPAGVETVNPRTLLRDRYPIRYKNELYHEHYDYQPTKELEERFQPPAFSNAAANVQAPNPNHASAALRTLPNSWLKVYKNGKFMGVAFQDLLAFLPPASRPSAQGVREGLDDGTLGYYPSVAVFSGGAVEANFGPNFSFPPTNLETDNDVDMDGATATPTSAIPNKHRPVSERYDEQIAEDVVFDVIDEVDCWMQDGGVLAGARPPAQGLGVFSTGPVGYAGTDGAGSAAGSGDAISDPANGTAEAIKELVQDDE
jgi:COMPASS component BRE2